jgi:DNA polymerase-3 subunit beta
MKLTCNRDALIEGINIVQKAVPSKSTMSVLEGILIEVGEELRLTGNDNEFGIVYEVPGIIEEIGSIVVNSKTFGDIIRKLPDIYVSLETDDEGNMLHITSGKASYKIKIMPPESYPPVSFLDTNNAASISCDLLCQMIKETSFAASLEDKRIILKGVFMEQVDSEMNFVAIDGFRLALKTAQMDESRDFGVIVPTKILNELVRSVKADDDKIKFCCNENQIMFYTDMFRMVAKLYKGDYIDYRKMIPREFKTTVTVSTKSLLNAFERAVLVMIDEKRYPLTIHFSQNSDVLVHVNAENGTVNEEVSADVVGEEMDVGFNARNFIECLKVIPDERIVISLTSPVGPCVIRGSEDTSFTYLLMPIKTKG